MSLVYAGVCSHAPGITGRADQADPEVRDAFYDAFHQIEWQDYLQRMRDGIEEHGPVREGVYAMTGYEGTDAHARRLGQGQTGSGPKGSDHVD